MNIQQVEYILAVAKLRNFGKAANKCCITQSTLSTMIAKYESEINIQIFDRRTKPVSITKEGEIIIRQLSVISKEISMLDEMVQSIRGELSGELKIGVIPTIAPFVLPRFLNGFTKKFPKIKFTVSEITTDNIKNSLLKRELDVGILAIPLEEEDLQEIPLYHEPFVLFDCSGNNTDKKVEISQINFDQFWLLAEGHCLHTQVKRICDYDKCATNAGINFDYKAGSIDSLIRFVKINKGVTMLPYLAAKDLSASDKKKLKYFNAPIPVRKIGLITHQHFVKKQILSLLKEEIQKKIIPLLEVNSLEERVMNPI